LFHRILWVHSALFLCDEGMLPTIGIVAALAHYVRTN
jgi:hypothetical protein